MNKPRAAQPIFSLHQHSAHCESGVISTLFRQQGHDISEAMAFGLSSSLAFAYLPLIKIGGQPLISYRMPPGHILKKLSRRLGSRLVEQRFATPTAGQQALDQALEQDRLVGLQTSVFWLPYFPPDMRFHFNAHNLLVFGKQGDDYLLSDPVFEHPVACSGVDLQKARFAKGALAAKGKMYYLDNVPEELNLTRAMRSALRDTVRIMDGLPIPIIGIRGIRYLARKIARLPSGARHTENNRLFLGHIVRMQEEIGTGGAGFRFLYASFLQEAAERLNLATLLPISKAITETGDLWREFATVTVKYCKGRGNVALTDLKERLEQCADSEQSVINQLRGLYPRL